MRFSGKLGYVLVMAAAVVAASLALSDVDSTVEPVADTTIEPAIGATVELTPTVYAYLPIVARDPTPTPTPVEAFSFAVTADMRYFSGPDYHSVQYFRGAGEALATAGGGAFMLTPGDMDPPQDVLWTIRSTLGTSYPWYPVVGNHDLPNRGHEPEPGANMAWLKAYDYGAVNAGPTGCPTTTYSFDYGNAHFVALNEYSDSSGADVRNGDVSDHLYRWLENDLSQTTQTHIFVLGHEPAYPQPDADNGRVRHVGDSLDQYPARRDRFWQLLVDRGVVAYICGHTHNYSAVQIDGIWQLDAGHARGLGDTGARSTFILIEIEGETVRYQTYRDDAQGGPYSLAHSGTLRWGTAP
ncbi:MAG: metallophosphoesterase [Anaerolineae bacterium]|jgi:hypothetical protein